MKFFLTALIGAALAAVAGVVWRRGLRAQASARRRLAVLRFAEQRPELGEAFRAAADATGKPRGLKWARCDLHPGETYALEPATGNFFALVGVTIGFEAIPGGGMEDVEAVGNLRVGTAVFVYRGEGWTTDGRAVLNLDPPQALEHYRESLDPVEVGRLA